MARIQMHSQFSVT